MPQAPAHADAKDGEEFRLFFFPAITNSANHHYTITSSVEERWSLFWRTDIFRCKITISNGVSEDKTATTKK